VTQSLNLFLSANNQPPSTSTTALAPHLFLFFHHRRPTLSFSAATVRTRVHTTTMASLQSSSGKLLCLSCFISCQNSLVFSSLSITTSVRGASFSLSVSYSDINISLIGFAGSNFDRNIDLHLLNLGAHCSEQR
jgi:hypothetical protein